jgi:hypothetical protein
MSYFVEVQLPDTFYRLNSIQPDPILGIDGYWYLLIYGTFDKAQPYRQYLFKWKPNTVVVPVPLTNLTDARGSIGVHPTGAALFSWQGSGDKPRLMVQDIPLNPTPLDSRVDTLTTQIAGLQQQIAELETALNNQHAAMLTDKQQTALNRLCVFLGLT